MKVTFYLARPVIIVEGKPQANPNPTVIFCRISYEGYRLKYYTPENISAKFWNSKAKPHRAKESTKFPEYPEFNRRLDSIEATIKTTIRNYINNNDGEAPTPKKLKPLLDTAILKGGQIEKMTFLKYFADYIGRCKAGTLNHAKTGKPLTAGTIKNYQTTLNTIEKYIEDTHKKVDFDSIDLDFYASFNEYLAGTQNQSLNTIGKHIKIMKSILNEATEQGVNKNLAYKSKKFITLTEDADTIYLSQSELQKIAGLDLTKKPRLDCIRDLFLVGCYTGLRFSDLSTLSPEQINDNMITITQIKTGKPVVIPVHDMVKTILKKYNGNLPTPRTNQKTNEYLKELCELVTELKVMVSVTGTKGGEKVTDIVGKYSLVSSHTARRSFATNQYLAGVPSLTIMAITGHKTEKSFLKYIRVTPDQHAKILQEFWVNQKPTKKKPIQKKKAKQVKGLLPKPLKIAV